MDHVEARWMSYQCCSLIMHVYSLSNYPQICNEYLHWAQKSVNIAYIGLFEALGCWLQYSKTLFSLKRALHDPKPSCVLQGIQILPSDAEVAESVTHEQLSWAQLLSHIKPSDMM